MTPRRRERSRRRKAGLRRKELALIYVRWALQYKPDLPPMPSAKTLRKWEQCET